MSVYGNKRWFKRVWDGFKNYTDGKLIWLVPLIETYGVYHANRTANYDIKTKVLEGVAVGAGILLSGALDYYLGGKEIEHKDKKNKGDMSKEIKSIQL